MKKYRKVGGYNWGLYYVEEEFAKMTISDLIKLRELVELSLIMKQKKGEN